MRMHPNWRRTFHALTVGTTHVRLAQRAGRRHVGHENGPGDACPHACTNMSCGFMLSML